MVAAVARTDVSYCDPNICPPGLMHVACGQDIVCIHIVQTKRIYNFLENLNDDKNIFLFRFPM